MASIRKRRGKWQVQVRREGQVALSRTFVYRDDAYAWARKIEATLDRGDGAVDTRLLRKTTVDHLLQRYLTNITSTKRGASVEAIRIACLRRSELSKLALSSATPDRFASYRDRRLSEVASATVRKEMALLHHMFRVARQEWNLPLGTNPLADLKAPAPGQARNRRLTADELGPLSAAIGKLRSPTMRALIRFALETGMRRGELLALRWSRVCRNQHTALIPETKTGHPRIIPLSSAALETLEQVPSSGSDLVFPLTSNAVKLAWQRVRARAGIPDMNFHDLRHEAISRFFERGLNLPEVALISGHRDVRMLLRYTHLRAQDVAAKLR